MIMAKKKSTETSENAVVNQENKEPKKKQEDILLEMIQRYRISHTKNGIFIHIPKTNGKLEAYNLNDSRLKIKLKSSSRMKLESFRQTQLSRIAYSTRKVMRWNFRWKR